MARTWYFRTIISVDKTSVKGKKGRSVKYSLFIYQSITPLVIIVTKLAIPLEGQNNSISSFNNSISCLDVEIFSKPKLINNSETKNSF